MSLATTYALACGLPLCEPEMHDSFFPLDTPLDKVILVHAFAGAIVNQNNQLIAAFPAKLYDHFNEVLDLLRPIVEPLGYRFYQIGGPNEPPLKGVPSLAGKTSYSQCAYLIKRAALLIGNDSMWMHLRGAERAALVEVMGPTDRKNHGPHWCDPEKTIVLESHRGGRKPSYASQEGPKTINFVPPEKLASAALKLLSIPDTITHQTVYIGPDYQRITFEIVPNMVPNPQLNLGIPAIRMDYHFDEQVLAQNLAARKCGVFTDKEINLNLIAQFKKQIHVLMIQVDEMTPQWIKQAKRIGVPIQATCKETDPEKVAAMRLALYDAVLFDTVVEPTVETLHAGIAEYAHKPVDSTVNLANLSFKTNRFLLSGGKIYLSTPHWRADRPTDSVEQNSSTVINTVEFWEEQRSHYYYTT